MEEKIRSAVAAKRDADFVIMARTDARSVDGLEAAIDRARRYVDAGADAIFPEGLVSEAEFAEFRAAVSGPLLANMTEFGKTPLIPVATFAEIGYQMVIFPVTAMRAVLKTMDETYSELLSSGTQASLMDRLRTRAELYERLEYDRYGEVGYDGR
jgi:methylisocitrate lyase